MVLIVHVVLFLTVVLSTDTLRCATDNGFETCWFKVPFITKKRCYAYITPDNKISRGCARGLHRLSFHWDCVDNFCNNLTAFGGENRSGKLCCCDSDDCNTFFVDNGYRKCLLNNPTHECLNLYRKNTNTNDFLDFLK